MINKNRLANWFKTLVEIDSVSRHEKHVAEKIIEIATKMGAEVLVDDSARHTGSDTGNLVLKFRGNRGVPPMLLSAHMDTVAPGNGIQAVLQDGVFKSAGETILGADDKSAIAIIFEIISVLQEKNLPYGPVEVVLTTCEEIGLQGAKHLDFDLISADFGYVLDTSDTTGIVTRAPAANRLLVKIHGKDAHAGVAPENGINAISVAASAIASLQMGRIDAETTCNFGKIQGGIAQNIVPSLVTLEGEVRSLDELKLNTITDGIIEAFENAVNTYVPQSDVAGRPRLEIQVENDFPATHIPADHPVITLALAAAGGMGKKLIPKTTGGGADANIFFKNGIMTGVIGTGMQDMHTVREWIRLDDMAETAAFVLEIIRLHAENGGA